MLRLTDLKLPLDHPAEALPAAICAKLGIQPTALHGYAVFRRGYDARKRGAIALIYTLDVDVADEAALLARHADDRHVQVTPDTRYHFVAQAPARLEHRPIVIGFGPCGLFAALILAQSGFRPIVLERGKAVRERTKDTWDLWRKRELHPDSNVQFGEGGAGTFSDGKLHSQIRDPRHHGRKVLTEFVAAGAPEEILYVSKPHIGTFRLVTMVENMRGTIEELGGEIRFDQRVDDLLIETDAPGERQVRGVRLASGEELRSDHVVLALGHSARDTFEMLHTRGVYVEAKPFSIGFRIEHPQSLIDHARFGPQAGHPILGAADYHLVHHGRDGRSVYSFCMCPGGTVVAATSEPGRVVTNGMSQYSRNERNANAAIVCDIAPADYAPYGEGPLAGIALQRHWESNAYALGGGDYSAPGQRVGDFLAGKPSRLRRRAALVQAGRASHRSLHRPARLCGGRDPRRDPRVRPPDQGLRAARRDAHRGGDAHFLAGAHQAPRRGSAEPQHSRPVPRRRRRGLCGRHSFRRSGRDPRGGGGGAVDHGPGACVGAASAAIGRGIAAEAAPTLRPYRHATRPTTRPSATSIFLHSFGVPLTSTGSVAGLSIGTSISESL